MIFCAENYFNEKILDKVKILNSNLNYDVDDTYLINDSLLQLLMRR